MTESGDGPAASLGNPAAAARQHWLLRYPDTITEHVLDASLAILLEAVAGAPGSALPGDLRAPPTLLHVRRELLDCFRRVYVEELQEKGRQRQTVLEHPTVPAQQVVQQMVQQMARFEEVRAALDPNPDEQVAASLSGPQAHEILAEVGHDLRSPLTSVLFLSETLRDSPGIRDDANQVRQLSMIYSGALTMLNVVNNFMELAESREGRVDVDPTVFSVEDLVESTRRTVQPMADAKGLGLRTRIDLAHSDRRRGYPALLTRVLLNLTTNAVKFTREGEVRIEAKEREPGVVEILVEDTGPGIDSAREEAIFSVFEPAQDRHGVRFIGTGLGLVIVRRLLAILDAAIHAPFVAAGSGTPQDVPAAAADTLEGSMVLEFQDITAEERARLEGVQQLLAIYRRMQGLRDVRIDLSGGILELRGTAISADVRDAAVDHAREIVPGVAFVDAAGLVVETDPRRRIEPVVERIQEQGLVFLRFIPTLLLGFLVLALGALAASWAGNRKFFIDRVARNPFAQNLLRQVVRAVVFLTALLLALNLMGVTALVGAVLGAAGVAGIAVGFAFRDIVENYLAGILLSLRQPFAPNDHVHIAGEEGRVVRLTGRETVLMTLDGNHVRIPNATVFKSVILNMTRNPRRRFSFDVGIAPSAAVGASIATARASVTGVNGVLESTPVAVRLHELKESSTTLRISGWVDQTESDFGKVRSRALRAVKEAFEDGGIVIPPPEFGIRILADARNEALRPDTSGRVLDPARHGAETAIEEDAEEEADVSPDTTIEDEIAREHRESDEEDLLQPPPGGS